MAKVSLRAQSGDEGADIAKRHLDGLAKRHGTTTEELSAAPDTYFRFYPGLHKTARLLCITALGSLSLA